VQQYQAQSSHFHTKKGEEHVRAMIAQSLGSFLILRDSLPDRVINQVERICDEMQLDSVYPLVYPAIEDLPSEGLDCWPLAIVDKCDFSL